MSAQAILPADILTGPGVRSRSKAITPKVRRTPVKTSGRLTRKKAGTGDRTRTSKILRDLLENNPTVQSFTVEKIVDSIGANSFGTSLMFFAIPEVLPIPIPGISAVVVLPTAVISAQMAAGQKQVKLPKFLLKRSVPRRALAAAIHAILPVLEKAEKMTKRRWEWATQPAARRLLGVFIFILAMAIAFPIPGFNMPQAISIFVISLGLVEEDGLLVAAGVLIGLASLVLLGGVVFGLFSIFGLGLPR